ncbi:pro-adrenomedullin-like [Brienomyrus brachyistius]|uniref:pro-adrenomedullin-like n=1 Tax=Brienomyrus brachyistius TaxID=42636 RepID=UPI0020B3F70B|nr:pro-adrenomedullin-like [Brienomyrus brachyistius]
MRPQTVLFLLLLVSMVATLSAATQNLGSKIRSRFSVWLMSRMKRHSGKVLVESKREQPELLVRAEDAKDTLNVHSSTSDFNVRVRRSKGTSNQSWRQGCPIATCTVHILAHRLSELSNHQNANSAPLEKISPGGYGRRRRALAGGRRQGAPFLQT